MVPTEHEPSKAKSVMKIVVLPNGDLRTVASRAEEMRLDLRQLGRVENRRASTVEWNETSQLWEVRWAGAPGAVVYSHPRRAACLAWEVRQLEKRIEK
jgi:hypothetical protein